MVWAVRVAGVFRSGAPSCVLLSGAAATVVDRRALYSSGKRCTVVLQDLGSRYPHFLPTRIAKTLIAKEIVLLLPLILPSIATTTYYYYFFFFFYYYYGYYHALAVDLYSRETHALVARLSRATGLRCASTRWPAALAQQGATLRLPF